MPVVCTFDARNAGVRIATLPSFLTPALVPNVEGGVSPGALSAVVNVGSTLTRTAKQFKFNYIPEPSGGIASISSGIAGVLVWNVSAYVNPDATSRILCTPRVLPKFATAQCTLYVPCRIGSPRLVAMSICIAW